MRLRDRLSWGVPPHDNLNQSQGGMCICRTQGIWQERFGPRLQNRPAVSAVENSKTLFGAAAQAGVARIDHFWVANASSKIRLPYFRDKGQVEDDYEGYGDLPLHLGPTLVFGEGDLPLINMAWALRRVSGLPCFRRGDYSVQPMYANDLATQAVTAGLGAHSYVADAAGPVTLTFEELLRLLASDLGAQVRLLHTPSSLGLALTRLVGLLLRNVVLTKDEVDGLMAELLIPGLAPTGSASLGDWLTENPDVLGQRYVSEMRRSFHR